MAAAELAPVYVAVEKPPLTTAQQPILAMLATHFPDAKVYEDHQVVGYRLTAVP